MNIAIYFWLMILALTTVLPVLIGMIVEVSHRSKEISLMPSHSKNHHHFAC